jgi:hypothetical protein
MGYGPCSGSTKVDWDFEYTDSVRRDQCGAITNGIVYGRVFRKMLVMFLLGPVMFLLGLVMFLWCVL